MIDRLAAVGHWQADDPDIVVVVDSDTIYTHVSQLAYMLADLPVELVGGAVGPGASHWTSWGSSTTRATSWP